MKFVNILSQLTFIGIVYISKVLHLLQYIINKYLENNEFRINQIFETNGIYVFHEILHIQ